MSARHVRGWAVLALAVAVAGATIISVDSTAAVLGGIVAGWLSAMSGGELALGDQENAADG